MLITIEIATITFPNYNTSIVLVITLRGKKAYALYF